jgi:uncharacterized protein YkwD
MNGKLSIIISVILVTAAILTVQSSSMLQSSYAQLCPDGSTPDASGNCATMPPPAGDGETAQAPPPATTEAPPPAARPATETPPPATETPPPATEAPPLVAPPAVASPQVSNNTGGMSADWANSILAVHNSERAAVGVPPLVWSDTLAASAQAWADHLATIPQMVHSGSGNGENIAGFFTDPTEPTGGTSLWVAEKQNWHGGVLTPENWYPTGHYTQMVWRNTQEVGCGTAPPGAGGPSWSTLVCQYNPPGNYMGQAPY